MDATTPFDKLKAYFLDLATRHKEINGSFQHGDARRFQAATRSALEYPCLWLEPPQFKLKHNGGGSFQLSSYGAFTILWNAPSADADRQDELWTQTNRIAMQFIAKLQQDVKARLGGMIDVDELDIDPIDTLFVDNDLGWRVEFRIKNTQDVCVNQEDWNDAATPTP